MERKWKSSGLEDHLNAGLSVEHSTVRDCLAAFGATDVKKKAAPRTQVAAVTKASVFSSDEEDWFASIVQQAHIVGNPINKQTLQTAVNNVLQLSGHDCGSVVMDTVERLMKRNNIGTEKKFYPVDIARAKQATKENHNTFIKRVDALIRLLHAVDPVNMPWKCFNDLPPEVLYNMDELAANPQEHRRPILAPKDLHSQLRHWQVSPEGDGRMALHISICLTTCAAGGFCIPSRGIDGAPPPFLIISDANAKDDVEFEQLSTQEQAETIANQTADDEIAVKEAVVRAFFPGIEDINVQDADELNKRLQELNPNGLAFRATKSGSMKKNVFMDFIEHFAKYLPKGQGPTGHWVVLFVDWHGSRAHAPGLMLCMEYRILLVVYPSKTSIWAQANDNGPNLALETCISNAAQLHNIFNFQSFDLDQAVKVFKGGIESFIADQTLQLRAFGHNAATTAFEKTGTYPLDYNNPNWREAINGLGELYRLRQDSLKRDGLDVAEISWVACLRAEREALTPEDEEAILGYAQWPDALTLGDTQPSPLICSHVILNELLHQYVQDGNRNKKQPPVGVSPAEKAALKLFQFEDAADKISTSSSRTAADKLREWSAAILRSTAIGKAVIIKKPPSGTGDDNLTFTAIKTAADKFVVYDSTGVSIPHSREELLDSWRVQQPEQQINEKEKKREQRHSRKRRREEQELREEEAKKQVRGLRSDMLFQRLTQAITDGNGHLSRHAFDAFMQDVDSPFVQQVQANGSTMEVVIEGSTAHAASTAARLALLEALATKNQTAPKKKVRRNAVVNSSRGGGDGVHFGAALFINHNTSKAESMQKAVTKAKEAAEAKAALIDRLMEHQEKKPSSYWKSSELKGATLNDVCRMFNIKTGSMKVQAKREAYEALEISQHAFDTKVSSLQSSLTSDKEELAAKEAQLEAIETNLNAAAGFATADADGEEEGDAD